MTWWSDRGTRKFYRVTHESIGEAWDQPLFDEVSNSRTPRVAQSTMLPESCNQGSFQIHRGSFNRDESPGADLRGRKSKFLRAQASVMPFPFAEMVKKVKLGFRRTPAWLLTPVGDEARMVI